MLLLLMGQAQQGAELGKEQCRRAGEAPYRVVRTRSAVPVGK